MFMGDYFKMFIIMLILKFRITSLLETMTVKNIKKITYLENQSLKIQINSPKLDERY